MAKRPWTTPAIGDSLNGVPLALPIVTNAGQPDEWRGAFGQFLIDNAGDPPDRDTLGAIAAALRAGHVWFDRLGAGAFTISRAPA